MDKSKLTAITRKTVSVPMRYLACLNRIPNGRMLDFGCGKGFDADHFGMDKYDLHHTNGVIVDQDGETIPVPLVLDSYDTITCNYVLNVIENPVHRRQVLADIYSLLAPNGYAYITVRRDIKQEGYTSKGTYQKNIVLNLPVLKEVKGSYCIYMLHKEA